MFFVDFLMGWASTLFPVGLFAVLAVAGLIVFAIRKITHPRKRLLSVTTCEASGVEKETALLGGKINA